MQASGIVARPPSARSIEQHSRSAKALQRVASTGQQQQQQQQLLHDSNKRVAWSALTVARQFACAAAATAGLVLACPSANAVEGAAVPTNVALLEQQQQQPQLLATLTEAGGGSQVYFDVAVDGRPLGRIVVQLYDDVPIGAARFAQLAQGLDGASYRRSKFDVVTEDYVQNSGVKQLTYRADAETRLAGGSDTFELEKELATGRHLHDGPGVVSLLVREPREREVKDKLVAYKGKLVNVQEVQGGEAPNGTGFAVTLRAAPELDAIDLPVGRVVAGADVLAALGGLPVVKDNSSSPFFQAGKMAGDKRAIVAERGFNRPFAKVVCAETGLLE